MKSMNLSFITDYEITLVRSIGCVMQAAPADAKPPKYHLDTILVAGLPPVDPAPDWPAILNKVFDGMEWISQDFLQSFFDFFNKYLFFC